MKTIIIILMLVLLVGCSNQDDIEWRDEKIDDLYLEINKYVIEEYNWYCVEYANKTKINPEWLETCCSDLGANLTDENREMEVEGKLEGNDVKYTFRKEGNNSAYLGGHMCFDVNRTGNNTLSEMQIGKQLINLSKCKLTPQMIETNESICIQQRRKGW